MSEDVKDYARSGLDVQRAMMDRATTLGIGEPLTIRWGAHDITTADTIEVRGQGVVRGEFLYVKDDTAQGFDLNVKGFFRFKNGQKVPTVRTWHDPKLSTIVEYPFHSDDGFIRVWNVYKMIYKDIPEIEEKWTGNAGFWVEKVNQWERIYHCSHGTAARPDFESLVFKISIVCVKRGSETGTI